MVPKVDELCDRWDMRVDARHSRPDFIPQLESLRGLAALVVAAFHAAQAPWANSRRLLGGAPDWNDPVWGVVFRIYQALVNGPGAVIFFFVLSGFVLSRSLRQEPACMRAVAPRFLLTRVARLYPAVITTILAFAVVFWVSGLAIPGVGEACYSTGSLLQHMLLLDTCIDGVVWSLQVELIAIPLILAAVWTERRRGAAPLMALVVLLLVLSFDGRWTRLIEQYPSRLGPLYCFVAGILIHRVGRPLVARLGARTGPALLIAAVITFFAARPLVGYASNWSPIFETWASATMILVLAYGKAGAIGKLLERPILRVYGRISYSFYLLHPMTLLVIWRMPDEIGAVTALGVPGVFVAFGLGVGSIAAITPVAWLSWRYVEEPGMKLGRRLRRTEPGSYRLGATEIATSAADRLR